MYALRKVLYILIVQMDLPTFIQNEVNVYPTTGFSTRLKI